MRKKVTTLNKNDTTMEQVVKRKETVQTYSSSGMNLRSREITAKRLCLSKPSTNLIELTSLTRML